MEKWLNIFSPKAVVLELLLISICIVDDSSVIPNVILENHLARAVVDTLTHGVIAALSWLLVTDFQMNTKNLTEVMSCGVFGMVIDVDHFIAAGSLSLSAATSLSKRPFFHNSSLIPIIYLLLRGLQQWLPGLPASMAWMFLLAWTSHHVRDGIRHGLWFAPFGSTPAVPKWLYISVISLCPLLLRAVLLLGRSNNVQGRNSSTTDHHETASLMTV